MRRCCFVVFAALSLGASLSFAGQIETRAISPAGSMPVKVAMNVMTSLLFPQPVVAVIGLGLADDSAGVPASGATIGVRKQPGSTLLALHAFIPNAHEVLTVLLADGKLYVFELVSDPIPDVAVTLVMAAGADGQTAAQAPPGVWTPSVAQNN
jgi:hypothetical protein